MLRCQITLDAKVLALLFLLRHGIQAEDTTCRPLLPCGFGEVSDALRLSLGSNLRRGILYNRCRTPFNAELENERITRIMDASNYKVR